MLTPSPFRSTVNVDKFNALHCMIDLETLGTEPGCPLLSIGAVFWIPSYDILVDKFYTEIDLSTYDLSKYPPSGDTIKWWLKQSTSARSVLVNNSGNCLADALRIFNESFIIAKEKAEVLIRTAGLEEKASSDLVAIWANGPTFDISILKHCFKQERLRWTALKYSIERCFRTFVDYCPGGLDWKRFNAREGVYHNALDDASTQVKAIMTAYYQYGYQINEFPKTLEGVADRAFSTKPE